MAYYLLVAPETPQPELASYLTTHTIIHIDSAVITTISPIPLIEPIVRSRTLCASNTSADPQGEQAIGITSIPVKHLLLAAYIVGFHAFWLATTRSVSTAIRVWVQGAGNGEPGGPLRRGSFQSLATACAG